ncbi:DUF2291 family protein [Mangrovibacterium sp.]|uniref:DUF2291 family protein n=1 Tax=Mangrovibacterium sp. TaxID=1961364 RepID=UPI0035688500
MKNKIVNYSLVAASVLAVVYFSLNIENLQEYQFRTKTSAFNATEYANQFWTESLPASIADAPDASLLMTQLNQNPEQAFQRYGKKLGISKTAYFGIKGNGIISSVQEEYIAVVCNRDTIKIATEFIFGNAVRDGSGQVDIDQFVNMTDFNNVSVAINKLVKEKVITRLKQSAATGKQIDFAGFAELREDENIPEALSIVPVKAIISDGKTE